MLNTINDHLEDSSWSLGALRRGAARRAYHNLLSYLSVEKQFLSQHCTHNCWRFNAKFFFALIRGCTCRQKKLFAINIYFSGWDMFKSTFVKVYLIFYGLLILVYLSALCVSLFLIPAFSAFWKIPRGKTIRHRHVLHAEQKNICSWLLFRRWHLKRNTPVSVNNWNVFNRKKYQMVIWTSPREFMSLGVAGSIFVYAYMTRFALLEMNGLRILMRCFDTLSRRPYRCFSIALKVISSLSDRHKIYNSDWPWIEVSQNAVFSKINITMSIINKKLWNRFNPNFARSRPATENPTPRTWNVVFSK